jgi:hypothetical protein
MYVNLGNGKCLSPLEVLQMSDTNRFLRDENDKYINPFTRQPLTSRQIVKINDILEASGQAKIRNVHEKKEWKWRDDDDTPTYQRRVINAMMSGRLTEHELEKAFIGYADVVYDYHIQAKDILEYAPYGVFWRIYRNKLQFKRPNGNRWIEMDKVDNEELLPDITNAFYDTFGANINN